MALTDYKLLTILDNAELLFPIPSAKMRKLPHGGRLSMILSSLLLTDESDVLVVRQSTGVLKNCEWLPRCFQERFLSEVPTRIWINFIEYPNAVDCFIEMFGFCVDQGGKFMTPSIIKRSLDYFFDHTLFKNDKAFLQKLRDRFSNNITFRKWDMERKLGSV